jgi:hypothetical protein
VCTPVHYAAENTHSTHIILQYYGSFFFKKY